MIKLRGHHLICLHFFQGEGYSPTFVDNLKTLVQKLESNEDINITSEADDVCAKCPYLSDAKCVHKTDSESAIRELDNTALNLLGFEVGQKIKWQNAKQLTMGIPPDKFRSFCKDCDWAKLCNKARF